jgi:hypothetical protein
MVVLARFLLDFLHQPVLHQWLLRQVRCDVACGVILCSVLTWCMLYVVMVCTYSLDVCCVPCIFSYGISCTYLHPQLIYPAGRVHRPHHTRCCLRYTHTHTHTHTHAHTHTRARTHRCLAVYGGVAAFPVSTCRRCSMVRAGVRPESLPCKGVYRLCPPCSAVRGLRHPGAKVMNLHTLASS